MKHATQNRIARSNMRAYAKMYRDALLFARRYREYNPTVFERWCVRAGMHLAEAIRERTLSQAV
jgi:hypothetical protein